MCGNPAGRLRTAAALRHAASAARDRQMPAVTDKPSAPMKSAGKPSLQPGYLTQRHRRYLPSHRCMRCKPAITPPSPCQRPMHAGGTGSIGQPGIGSRGQVHGGALLAVHQGHVGVYAKLLLAGAAPATHRHRPAARGRKLHRRASGPQNGHPPGVALPRWQWRSNHPAAGVAARPAARGLRQMQASGSNSNGAGSPSGAARLQAAASQPTWRPMVSMMNTRPRPMLRISCITSRRLLARYLAADGKPGLKSVPSRSLSMVLGTPSACKGRSKALR